MAEQREPDPGAPQRELTAALDERGPRAQPPEERTQPAQSTPRAVAGGIPAVLSSIRHAFGEAGPLRGTRLLLRLNQFDGYDCPGCAWPEPDGERSIAEFCENGAKAIAEEGTKRRVEPSFFAAHTVAELSRASDFWLGKRGRLTHPMVLRPGEERYAPISWDDAFQLVAGELNSLSSPDEAVFYTSGRTSNEAAFLYQLFVRQFGTNNLPDCSNLCHESSGAALVESIGVGKGTVKLDDFDQAEVIVVVGQNPGTNHPRMLTALERARRNGATIVAVNPLREAGLLRFKHPQELRGLFGAGTDLCSLFLQVRINGDVALLQGVGKEMLEEESRRPGSVVRRDFVPDRTEGYEEYARALGRVCWDDVLRESGVPREQIRQFAALLCRHERIIFCWAMGLTQHENAVANIQEIVNLLLLRGSIGKPGAGVCPVRGHSNVQGDRTMGIWDKPSAGFLDALQREFHFAPPRRHGHDTVGAIRAMHDGSVKVFFALGGNFLAAAPDTEYTARGLRRARLTVHVSTKLNRSHLVTGAQALVLPCLGRTERDVQAGGEQFVTTENSMGVVQTSRGRMPPAWPDLLSEPAIVARLARATLRERSAVDWEWLVQDYDRIRDSIARVVSGFADYNRRVRTRGGFYLPNAAREGFFATAARKARFTVHEMPRRRLPPGQLLLTTVRSHDQYNTTIYGLSDRYRGLRRARRVVLLNRQDMAERGLSPKDRVDVTSHFEGETRTALGFYAVPYDIPRGCAAAYFPEANALVPIGSVAKKSNTPASKSVVITLARAASA